MQQKDLINIQFRQSPTNKCRLIRRSDSFLLLDQKSSYKSSIIEQLTTADQSPD